MVDFIRVHYREKDRLEKFVLDVENFEKVEAVLDYHTGEVNYPYRTKLGNMEVGVSNRFGFVKNSVHKLYNHLETGIEHNHNDFTYSQLCSMIDYLKSNLIDVSSTRLTQLEFGLNLKLDTKPDAIIRRNVLMHQNKGGNSNQYHGKGELKQFSCSNFFIKVYDKGMQYELKENILRFEIKFIKAVEFNKLGVFNVADLKVESNLRNLFDYLLFRFKELTIVDDIDEHRISDAKDYNKLSRYINPNFWSEEIKGKHQETRARHRREFERLLVKYDLLKTKMNLLNLLEQKFNFLINN